MIASLTGTLKFINSSQIIIDVNGIGYNLNVSSNTLSKIGKVGDVISVLTDLQIKDDKILMYGFHNKLEMNMFKLLQTIQGIGPKASISILSALDVEQIVLGINSSDKNIFLKADGIGSRVATRIVTELKDKIKDFFVFDKKNDLNLENFDENSKIKSSNNKILVEDCISAIVNLGYTRSDAFSAVMNAKELILKEDDESQITIEKLVPIALKKFIGQKFE